MKEKRDVEPEELGESQPSNREGPHLPEITVHPLFPPRTMRSCTDVFLQPLMSGLESGEENRWTNASLPTHRGSLKLVKLIYHRFLQQHSNNPPWIEHVICTIAH